MKMRRLAALIITVTIANTAFAQKSGNRIESFLTDSLDNDRQEILEQLANMPNIEIGKGVTFRPKNDSY